MCVAQKQRTLAVLKIDVALWVKKLQCIHYPGNIIRPSENLGHYKMAARHIVQYVVNKFGYILAFEMKLTGRSN